MSFAFAFPGEFVDKNRKWLCFLPFYHAMAQTIFIAGALRRGIPVYIMKKFDFVQMLENVQRFRISTLTMVPPIVVVRLLSSSLKNRK